MLGDGSRRYVLHVDSKDPKSRFQLLLRQPDAQLPLDVLSLLICQLAGEEITVEHEQAQVDALALAIGTSCAPSPSFEGVISWLFGANGALRGNVDDYYAIDNSLLSRVRSSGHGMPITLSVLAIECARRLNVPMVGIGLPGHFIVRSADDDALFADPFNGGTLLDRDGVRSLFHRMAGTHAPWHDTFLRPVSSRDIVFRILNNLKVACTRSVADHAKLPWVLELLSWFPQGEPFNPQAVSRLMSPYN